MAGSKLLTDRAHRDGSPVQRNRSDIKKTFDVAKVNADDKVRISDRSSVSNKSSGIPMKMLLANEMTKKTERRKKSPNVSVVARLMGLEDDILTQMPVLPSNKRDSKAAHSFTNIVGTNMVLRQQENHHNRKPVSSDFHFSSDETDEYKDVYEVCQQPTRNDHVQENRNNKKMEVVRQKFMEAKRFATDENLLHSKEFQEALEVLSSNRDVFLKFLEEPNSIFSEQSNGLPAKPPLPQTKRITVLKPVKSAESKEGRQAKQQQVNESRWERRKQHQRSRSTEENFSQPTRIVVLKPSPGKSNEKKAELTPRATSTEPIHRTDFYGGLEDNEAVLGSREVFHDRTQQLREGCHRRDESLLSSVYSNGYGGDESSLSRTEIEFIEEESCSFSDTEIVSLVPRYSWDYINRFSPYSTSSSESVVLREAKKRLSERWAMVTHDEVHQVQMRVPRTSSTLGQMLSLKEVKKEENASKGLVVSSSRSCDAENESRTKPACLSIDRKSDGDRECSPRNLLRSKSVPLSSLMYDSIDLDAPGTNFQDSKVTKDAEIAKPNKGKSFFKGKVSNFFSRNKKPAKEKLSRPPAVSDEKVKVPCDGGTSLTEMDHGVVLYERVAASEVKNEKVASSSLNIEPESSVSIIESRSSNFPIGNLGKLASNEGRRISRDQPSPTSVFDASFEDNSNTEPESCSSSSTGSLQALSRCSAIESVARSLSWDNTYLEAPSLCTRRFSSLSIVENDVLERCTLVQNLMSSLGLDSGGANMIFTGWYSPNCPLNPSLLEEFLDRKAEAAKSRERRSNQRLLFDSVNAAILEIGETSLVSAFPCTEGRAVASRDLNSDLVVQVLSLVKDWFNGDSNLLAAEIDNTSLAVEKAVESEVEGRGWCKLMRSEVDDIIEDIGGKVLEELVGEALVDFSI